jgi:hypothetical protein
MWTVMIDKPDNIISIGFRLVLPLVGPFMSLERHAEWSVTSGCETITMPALCILPCFQVVQVVNSALRAFASARHLSLAM